MTDVAPLVLGGRYEVGDVLGRGGMAEVHRATDLRLGRVVAVKMLRADLARDPEFQDRFRREAQSAASLNHPSIVAVYDTGEDWVRGARVPYIVMELVQGSTLRDLLAAGQRPLPERALEIASGILTALDYSHRHGIVHRDIKPGNVMLTPRGEVKVMDFGIARTIAEATAAVTTGSAVVGTAQYLSPEQARGEQVDARTDLYSTGCVLFELLTGRPPFVGESPVSVAYQHVSEQPPAPSSFDANLSPAVDAVVLTALAKERSDRYQTAAEMRADVDRLRSGREVAARPPDATTATQAIPPIPGRTAVTAVRPMPTVREAQLPYVPPPRRSRRQAGGWLVLLLALAAVGGAFYFLGRQYLADRMVFVPDVRDYTVAEATSALQQAHLRVAPDQEQRADATIAKGKVVGTDPTGEVRRNAQVQLVISTGPQTVPVPALQGKKVTDAEDILTRKGLGYRVTEVDSSQDEGTVVDTNPQVGTSVHPGATVLLKVSNARVAVPDVVGQQVTDAKALLKNSEGQFKSAARSEPTTDPTKDQVVLRVGGVDKDGTAKKGSTINLIYGVYTPPQPSGGASASGLPAPSPS